VGQNKIENFLSKNDRPLPDEFFLSGFLLIFSDIPAAVTIFILKINRQPPIQSTFHLFQYKHPIVAESRQQCGKVFLHPVLPVLVPKLH
jgi:hypothetical protein